MRSWEQVSGWNKNDKIVASPEKKMCIKIGTHNCIDTFLASQLLRVSLKIRKGERFFLFFTVIQLQITLTLARRRDWILRTEGDTNIWACGDNHRKCVWGGVWNLSESNAKIWPQSENAIVESELWFVSPHPGASGFCREVHSQWITFVPLSISQSGAHFWYSLLQLDSALYKFGHRISFLNGGPSIGTYAVTFSYISWILLHPLSSCNSLGVFFLPLIQVASSASSWPTSFLSSHIHEKSWLHL